MNIETEICKALATVFQGLLTDVEIRGNWLPDDGIKGAEVYAGKKLEINVGTRRYDGYSSPVAEFAVTLEGTFAAAEDTSLDETVYAYETTVGKLESWHHNLATVKTDLTIANLFTPVGLRLDGGSLDIDRDTKTRTFTQQFTLKGRIS